MTPAENSPSGPYLAAIEDGIATHQAGLEKLWATARAIKKDHSLAPEARSALLSSIYANLSMKDLTSPTKSDLHEYDIGVSFRSCMAHMQHVKRRLGSRGYKLARGANPKLVDRAFAQKLGVPTPRTIAQDQYAKDLPIIPRTVIKPISGSRAHGVFHVSDDASVQSFSSGIVYASLSEALVEVEGSSSVNKPVWIVEETIPHLDGRPANDLKAYSFYGQVGMVVEIARGQGARGTDLYCFYGPSGEIIDSGRSPSTSFEGAGVPPDLAEKARVLSVATPVPFIRVDFHRGADQCYLGEITPHPGGITAGLLPDALDKQLGGAFLDAEARLQADLLEGKTFNPYFEIYEGARTAIL